jgi:hypothetical protein
MKKLISIGAIIVLGGAMAAAQTPAAAPASDTAELRQEIEQLKKTVLALEDRLAAQEKAAQEQAKAPATNDNKQTESVADLQARVKDLDQRVNKTERKSGLDRLAWSGDFRVESHSIFGSVPAHYDGMKLQNMVVRTLWMMSPTSQGGMGMAFDPNLLRTMTPAQFTGFVNNQVASNYGAYQYFTSNLSFSGLKSAMGQFSPDMQQALMSYLQQAPGVAVARYAADTNTLMTNRLRLNFDARVADNVSVQARLSMYKTFGDSTNVQVFNGQANTLNLDGTTSRVPTGDMVRVERAFFTWNKIAGLPLYVSIGRRPSTDGPPLNFREDELRGGTPSGALFDYQYDGVTIGYHVTDKTALRLCYGMGYTSGFGNGNLLQSPADRLKSVHLMGGMVDLYETEKTFLQVLVAHAWNVTDGFNGTMVLPVNPLTGDSIAAPIVMRYTPSANLGSIGLYGVVAEKRLRQFDLYFSGNVDSLRPNGQTTPFGGLGSDPFETPTDHNGYMVYAGVRFNVPQNDGRTKFGFEFNHGSKYWFNFAQAEDDILAPKTSARGDVYETYLTHRITSHFIFKVDFQRFNYNWSGSGWHLGAPKRLDSMPLLGFPTYDTANMFSAGLTARF